MLRPRVVVYPALLLVVWGALAWALVHRPAADVTVLRGVGSPFSVLTSGLVSNQIRVKIVNRTGETQHYRIELTEGSGALRMIAPDAELAVAPGRSTTATIFIVAPADAFERGARPVRLRVSDDSGWTHEVPYRLLGPVRDGAVRGIAGTRA